MKSKSLYFGLFLFIMLSAVGHLSAAEKPKVLRHVVEFKFSPQATAENIQRIENSFAALPQKIKEIKNFEWGTNVSPEGISQGLTHCFILTFTSDKDRDAYLVHPDHKAFGKSLGKDLEKVTVIDFWTK
ncbi:MAG: Dabb family protein [Bacteroidia bacterium]|nr:Dabb family protein [Bacteroidia bacterium]